MNRKVNRESSARGKSEISLWIRSRKKKRKKHPSFLPGPQTQSGSTSGRFDRTGGNSILQYERLIVVPRDWTFDFETWAALVAVNQAEVTNRFSIVSCTLLYSWKRRGFSLYVTNTGECRDKLTNSLSYYGKFGGSMEGRGGLTMAASRRHRDFSPLYTVSVARVKFGNDSVIANRTAEFFVPPRCIILFRRKVGNTWQSFRLRCMRVCLCFVLDRKSLVGCEVDRVTIASLMGMEGKCNTMKCDLFNIIFRWRNMGNIYSSNMVRK